MLYFYKFKSYFYFFKICFYYFKVKLKSTKHRHRSNSFVGWAQATLARLGDYVNSDCNHNYNTAIFNLEF